MKDRLPRRTKKLWSTLGCAVKQHPSKSRRARVNRGIRYTKRLMADVTLEGT